MFHGVIELMQANQSGGLTSNLEHFGGRVKVEHVTNDELAGLSGAAIRLLLHDPQTSGGLLIAAAANSADEVERAICRASPQSRRIGVVQAREQGVDVLVRR